MATTYTQITRLAIIQPLDPATRDSWGPIQDATMPLIEQLAIGITEVPIDGLTTYVLTTANNAPDQARYLVQQYTGALTADCVVTLPNVARIQYGQNQTTGGFKVTLTSGGGTTLDIPDDSNWYMYWTDGTGNVAAVPVKVAQTISGNLAVNGNVSATGSGSFGGTLAAIGQTTLQALAVQGNINAIGGTNNFSGSVIAALVTANTLVSNGGLTVAGSSVVTGNQTIGGAMNVGDDVALLGAGTALQVPNGATILNIMQTTGAESSSQSGWDYSNGGPGAFGPTTVSYSIVAGGSNMLASNYYAVSDVRVKFDIADITGQDGLDWLDHAAPKTYRKRPRWNSPDDEAVIEAGFIAQEQIRAGYGQYASESPHEGMPETEDGPADIMVTLPVGYQVAYLTAALKQERAERLALLERLARLERRLGLT